MTHCTKVQGCLKHWSYFFWWPGIAVPNERDCPPVCSWKAQSTAKNVYVMNIEQAHALLNLLADGVVAGVAHTSMHHPTLLVNVRWKFWLFMWYFCMANPLPRWFFAHLAGVELSRSRWPLVALLCIYQLTLMRKHMPVHTHTHIYTHTHARTHAHTYTTHACTHTRTHTLPTPSPPHTYIHTHTHTHTHTTHVHNANREMTSTHDDSKANNRRHSRASIDQQLLLMSENNNVSAWACTCARV